jgi:hypothetical protein
MGKVFRGLRQGLNKVARKPRAAGRPRGAEATLGAPVNPLAATALGADNL